MPSAGSDFQPVGQGMRAELVHQEADGAAMHAVDRFARTHVAVQRLQHQAIAAERNDNVCLIGLAVAEFIHELLQRLLRFVTLARHESDTLIFAGGTHRDGFTASWSPAGRQRGDRL